jgi:hypothetical protein
MGGYQNSAGHVSNGVEANEFTGSDVAPGFHAVEAPTTVNGQAVTEFGYYAGPAVKITGTVGGNTVQADQAQWSVNPRIVVFWFSPQADPSGADVAGLAAFNAQGQPLPAGHNTVATADPPAPRPPPAGGRGRLGRPDPDSLPWRGGSLIFECDGEAIGGRLVEEELRSVDVVISRP